MVRAAAAFVVAGLVGPALGGTAAAQIRCPTELTINEQPVAPPGMRGAPAQRTRALQRISVFDGLPSEKKEIKPSRGAGDAAIQVYTLPEPRLRPTIVVCHYADTPVTLTAPVPTTVKRCIVRAAAQGKARRQVDCS